MACSCLSIFDSINFWWSFFHFKELANACHLSIIFEAFLVSRWILTEIDAALSRAGNASNKRRLSSPVFIASDLSKIASHEFDLFLLVEVVSFILLLDWVESSLFFADCGISGGWFSCLACTLCGNLLGYLVFSILVCCRWQGTVKVVFLIGPLDCSRMQISFPGAYALWRQFVPIFLPVAGSQAPCRWCHWASLCSMCVCGIPFQVTLNVWKHALWGSKWCLSIREWLKNVQ